MSAPAAEERFRQSFEHAPIGMAIIDLEGSLIDVNPAFCQIVGHPRAVLIGAPRGFVIHPEELEADEEAVKPLLTGERRTSAREKRYIHADGHIIWALTNVTAIHDAQGCPDHLILQVQDISERREQEQALRESEARLRAIVEHAPAAIVMRSLDGRFEHVNARAAASLGIPVDVLIGRVPAEHLPAQSSVQIDLQDEELMRTGEPIVTELAVPHTDGTVHDYHVVRYPVRDVDGEVIGLGSFSIEITERNLLTRQLAASERMLRATIDRAPIGISIFNREGELLSVNATLCALTGYAAAELAARWPDELAHPDEREIHRLRFAPLLAGEVDELAFEERYIHADGTTKWAQIAVATVRDDDDRPSHFVSQFQDITQRKLDEERLRTHAREQEALRALATLVASEADPLIVHADAARRAAEVLNADFSAVACRVPGGGARVVGSWSAAPMPVARPGTPLDLEGGSALATALRTGRAVNLPRYDPPLGNAVAPAKSALAAPIIVDGTVWGSISVGWNREAAGGVRARERIARVADLVSLAVSGAEARAQLARLASTDPLTGLDNQRAFFERLEGEIERARRRERQLSLIVLDLDHFKLVNDMQGHEAGNLALVEFTRRLLSVRRQGETLGRIGGEEFAWILPDTSGEKALYAAERARRVIADADFDGIGRITTSIGICALDDARDAAELFRRADRALYWSKSSGRNICTRYTPEELSLVTAAQRSADLRRAQAVRALAAAVDAKDPGTQRHSERVAALAARLAAAAGWSGQTTALLEEAALVHDVGKIAIPDMILLKCEPLTEDEYRQVQSHALLGAQMLIDLLSNDQVDWIRHHHERWDGGGYPYGLAGGSIPEGARLLAVADAWDAMTVARSYGTKRPLAEALHEVELQSGTQFCPRSAAILRCVYERGELP